MKTAQSESRGKRHPARRNDPKGMRRKVLDAAYSMFQAAGYNGTSMQDLIDRIDVTGGALHHHFPSKKSIGLAVLNERIAPVVRGAWVEPIRSADSLGKGIQSVFDDIARGVESRDRISGCPLNNLTLELSLADNDFRAAARGIFHEWQQALVDRIRESRGGKRLSRAARADIAAFIVSSYSGAMTLAKAEQNARPLRTAARVLKRWLESNRLDS
jgi:AcrR family transcriptional regulator